MIIIIFSVVMIFGVIISISMTVGLVDGDIKQTDVIIIVGIVYMELYILFSCFVCN